MRKRFIFLDSCSAAVTSFKVNINLKVVTTAAHANAVLFLRQKNFFFTAGRSFFSGFLLFFMCIV